MSRSLAWLAALATSASLLAGCGGNSTETTITGGGVPGTVVVADSPTGPNTTEIIVDAGPGSGFSLSLPTNSAYVSVTLCTPGSSTACVVVDHVLLDTGSIGLRVFRGAVASLGLPALNLPADAASGTPAGPAAECYPFVIGAVWGSMAQADVRMGGELAPNLPIQIIDDGTSPTLAPPPDCVAAANSADGLMNSAAKLGANGILGIGMIRYDCGLNCVTANYADGFTLYYACPNGAASCVPAAVPGALQMQNPIASFVADANNVANNNGSVIVMPALPELGAAVVKGRLVFGIGTQSNNQIPLAATIYPVDTNAANPTYLTFGTSVGARSYPASYIDTGANALFFEDTSLNACPSPNSSWYCPAAVVRQTATITGSDGRSGTADFAIRSADDLFRVGNLGFANLGGSAGQGADTFVWGLPFFYGRTVLTSIWGQALSANGPWNAF